MTTVVIGGGAWGKGSTLDEAKRNFSRYGGSLSAGYVIFTFGSRSEFAGVDEEGRVHWSGDDPAERRVEATAELRCAACVRRESERRW